jgi:hypothetical protein
MSETHSALSAELSLGFLRLSLGFPRLSLGFAELSIHSMQLSIQLTVQLTVQQFQLTVRFPSVLLAVPSARSGSAGR